MLIIESMDGDSEVRRVSPIALHGGDTGFGKYTDLMNGPMDHGISLAHDSFRCYIFPPSVYRMVYLLYVFEALVDFLQHCGYWN